MLDLVNPIRRGWNLGASGGNAGLKTNCRIGKRRARLLYHSGHRTAFPGEHKEQEQKERAVASKLAAERNKQLWPGFVNGITPGQIQRCHILFKQWITKVERSPPRSMTKSGRSPLPLSGGAKDDRV
jgi:hypothetical protein